jgi:hypothetical protein
MQNDSAILIPERETIELPEVASESTRHSPLFRACFWVALVLVGAGAMYAMYFRCVARASGAFVAEELSSSTVGGTSRLSEFLSDGRDPLPGMRAAMDESGPTLRTLMTYSARQQVPLSSLRCNPFHQPDPAPASHARPTARAATQPHPEAERAAMLHAVETMQLQSILCTDTHRTCMINNVLYDEGGIIKGFTIEQINAQTVAIRNGLYRFELTMNH